MYIPEEFMDYIITQSHLGPGEQEQRSVDMHLKEIEERAVILCDLKFDREAVKRRIKSYIRWGFEFFDVPSFYNSVDSIVDGVYERHYR